MEDGANCPYKGNLEPLMITEKLVLELKDTVDQEGECDFESYVLNSIIDVYYDDLDIAFVNMFEIDDLFFSKVNAMNSNFA